MLPPLDRLSLRNDTGEFVVLDQAAVDDLNARDVLDPISMERPIQQGTFRVRMRTPSPDGTPRYSYWKPEDLWNWVRRPESNGRMPDNREQIWYEDWWALYYTYGPIPTVPGWARSLDKRAPSSGESEETTRMPESETARAERLEYERVRRRQWEADDRERLRMANERARLERERE